ncbi:MAG: PLP-dependent transferase [Candidatus Burarchaeum sp.]|nr:PLP-dependent transferase [Candidatus Burarchaeum sp.]MDO8339032.1 PLP-dependent transferase [Candidatus Burarchaeum sp.]
MEEGPLGPIRWNNWRPYTILAHAGANNESRGNFVVTPVVMSTTVPTDTCQELALRFEHIIEAGRTGGIYVRMGTVNGFELECALTGILGCGDTMVFGSGMAAINAALESFVAAGENIVAHKTLYGCTYDLLTKNYPSNGVEVRLVDLRDPTVLRGAVDGWTRAVFFETPTNPKLEVIDIAKVAEEVKDRCPVIVDNTFASPMGQNPFEYGAHVVVHSLTKSIGGLSQAVGGSVSGSGKYMMDVFSLRTDTGAILPATEAYTITQGMRTLHVRYKAMEENAIQVAEFLQAQIGKGVEAVYYPGLDPRYPFGGQMKGPGYMVSFTLLGDLNMTQAFMNSLEVFIRAVSLGSADSYASQPASTTHARVPSEARQEIGILDNFIRLSIGIEYIGDLISDLKQAFAKVAKL